MCDPAREKFEANAVENYRNGAFTHLTIFPKTVQIELISNSCITNVCFCALSRGSFKINVPNVLLTWGGEEGGVWKLKFKCAKNQCKIDFLGGTFSFGVWEGERGSETPKNRKCPWDINFERFLV